MQFHGRKLLAAFALVGASVLPSHAQSLLMPDTLLRAPIPASVQLYERLKPLMPDSQFRLHPCTVLARADTLKKESFWLLPTDALEQECPASIKEKKVIVAYGGWCASGIEDDGPDGPHFSQSFNPRVTIARYQDGIVLYIQNYLKHEVLRTATGEAAALAFLQRIQAGARPALDIRPASVRLPLFAPAYVPYLPLKKSTLTRMASEGGE